MTFPHTFGPLPGPIPLSYLDDNFNAISTSAPFDASVPGDPGSIALHLQQTSVSATDEPYNAVGDGVTDDSAALTAAQAAYDFIYLPEGKTFYTSTAVNYWQFYGPGKLVTTGQTYDVPPYPKTGSAIYAYNNLTFGSYENAVAAGITINTTHAQFKENVQVNGTSGSGYATTPAGVSRDHVALYLGALPGTAVVTGASSSYTANTLTAAEIGSAAAGAIKPGMIVDTLHAGIFTGTVQSVSGSTIVVDAWWLQGATPTAGTPANGTGATINPTKIVFGQNIVAANSSTGTDSAHGLEIDLFCSNATGASDSVAFDALGLGTQTPLAGYRARSAWQIGFFSQGSGVSVGFRADNASQGFLANNCTNPLVIQVSNVAKFVINSLGNVQNDFRNVTVNAAATYAITAGDTVIVNSNSGAVLTLPAVTGIANRCYTVVANAAAVVKNQGGTTIATVLVGTSKLFACDGTFWY